MKEAEGWGVVFRELLPPDKASSKPQVTFGIFVVVLRKLLPPDKASSKPQVTFGIFFEEDPAFPVRVFEEPAPQGFPKELLGHLADYMARGFNRAIRERALIKRLHSRPVGRPIDPEVQRIGKLAAKLRKEQPQKSWGEIALQSCPKRGQSGHRCRKKCADRIQQAAKPFLKARNGG
jgi:hypothetical protein